MPTFLGFVASLFLSFFCGQLVVLCVCGGGVCVCGRGGGVCGGGGEVSRSDPAL